MNCERCGKEIPERRRMAKYCVKCSNLIYREKQKLFRETHREELKERAKGYYKKKKAKKKNDNTD